MVFRIVEYFCLIYMRKNEGQDLKQFENLHHIVGLVDLYANLRKRKSKLTLPLT